MTSGLKPSSAHAHSACLACCGPAYAHAQPARCGLAACSRSPRANEAGPGATPQRSGARAGAHAARVTADDARTAPHRGASGYGMSHGKIFTVSTQGARRTRLTWLGGRAMRRQKLTGVVDDAEAQRR
jgi:hypothetical protein